MGADVVQTFTDADDVAHHSCELCRCAGNIVAIALGLAEHSLLMNLLNRMQEDGHDVSGAAAEFTTMVSYIVGVSKCLNDIRTHAQYITKNTAGF